MKGKIALVTGASRGIGAAVAKCLGKEGAHVILVARTIGGLEEVDDEIKKSGGSSSIAPLDLKEYEKINQLAFHIADRYGKLDILVGNAAILGGLRPLHHYTPKIWNDVISVNLTANWHLIRSFDALLRNAENGRAVFVSSGLAQIILPYWGPYAASKAALEMMVKTYAAEVSDTSIRVNLVDPGEVRTRMHEEAMPGQDPLTLPEPESIIDVFMKLLSPSCRINGEVVEA